MASDFKETNRMLSRHMRAEAVAAGVFEHPTARGDGREEILRSFLRDRVGTTFGVAKAEVVDAHGRSSGELDVVVYDQRVASCLAVQGQRRIVRAEAVVLTIEVKSTFEASSAELEAKRVRDGIGRLRRYYRPTALMQAFMTRPGRQGLVEDVAAFFNDGIGMLDAHPGAGVPALATMFFGFDGPGVEVLKAFASTPLLDAVCILGKHTVARGEIHAGNGSYERIKGAEEWASGDDALGAFLYLVEGALNSALDARTLALPNPTSYYRPRSLNGADA